MFYYVHCLYFLVFLKFYSMSTNVFEKLVWFNKRTRRRHARLPHARYFITRLCGRGAVNKHNEIYIIKKDSEHVARFPIFLTGTQLWLEF